MAHLVQVLLTDDIDGNPADETVEFGLDGKVYVIDLNDVNAHLLRTVFDPYVYRARKAPGGKTVKRVDLPASSTTIRAWAASNGHAVSSKGRIPAAVVAAFKTANDG